MASTELVMVLVKQTNKQTNEKKHLLPLSLTPSSLLCAGGGEAGRKENVPGMKKTTATFPTLDQSLQQS